ncbi:hypothetical protein [Peristeroidobacter agariperforans]|uniref:hypothetical protein n=1 Tax=Peristeroidobacter agariperforans TaxID=268404 RepID=UPI00101CD65C|nr:hypothetical protein [Peristeroidobacter agariperforans]
MRFIRILLQCIGALALIVVAGVAVYAFMSFSGPKKSTDKDDALFVLNWGGFSTTQNWTVIDGSVSARDITGDHTDYYCIQLEDVSVTEPMLIEWQTGPETNDLLAAALEQSLQWAEYEGADCFPSFEMANSQQMKIMFWGMNTHGRVPAGAQVLLLQPSTKRLFYVSFAT